ncbi:MAG: SgcJ/EcaC family oxidoreductase [Salibacteraceae bacterium]
MKTLTYSFFLLLIFFLGSCEQPVEDEISSIHAVLDRQKNAWNRGDLGAYMNGYWDSEELIFTSSKSIAKGRKDAVKHYKHTYKSKLDMGVLEFNNVSTKLLSSKSAFTVGEWSIKRDSHDLKGRFTLIWQKIDRQWLIIADHSS